MSVEPLRDTHGIGFGLPEPMQPKKRKRGKAKPPTYAHLRESSRVDFQVRRGPKWRYLMRLRSTLGEERWEQFTEAMDAREAWQADLLLATWFVPFELSPERAAFDLQRERGEVGVEVDPNTVRHVERLAEKMIGKEALAEFYRRASEGAQPCWKPPKRRKAS